MTDILMLRSQNIVSDSRVLRYENWFQKHDISYRIVGWDREQSGIERENTIYCRIKAGFQQKSKAIIGRIKWNAWLMKYLYGSRKSYRIIHACDFDTVLPALVMQLFGKKVIFDIFDWFSDETRTGKWFIDKTINFLERWAVQKADLVILCEAGRLKQIQCIPNEYIVIPNIPSVPIVEFVPDRTFNKTIGYVGGIVADRGLEELVHVIAKLPDWTLHIAGFGDERLVKEIEEYSRKYENIHYYGKVPYDEAIKIMRSVDLIYAMYYTNNRNHVFAAPNKFYEAIFLQKPIITTEGTLVGDKVRGVNSGYVIDEGEENLKKLLSLITTDDIKHVKLAIRNLAKINSTLFDRVMQRYLAHISVLYN